MAQIEDKNIKEKAMITAYSQFLDKKILRILLHEP